MKIKKTFRLEEDSVTSMEEIKEIYHEEFGISLSYAQVIEAALYLMNGETAKAINRFREGDIKNDVHNVTDRTD